MKLKTKKALSKRLKITKTGKVLKRREGQGHFNSRATGNQTRRKRRDLELSTAHKNVLKTGLPHQGF